jgi:hypothetical protein
VFAVLEAAEPGTDLDGTRERQFLAIGEVRGQLADRRQRRASRPGIGERPECLDRGASERRRQPLHQHRPHGLELERVEVEGRGVGCRTRGHRSMLPAPRRM